MEFGFIWLYFAFPISVRLRYSTTIFFSPSFRTYMHAASGFFSWSIEVLAFASRQFAPKITDLCPLHSFFSVFPGASAAAGSRPPGEPPCSTDQYLVYCCLLLTTALYCCLLLSIAVYCCLVLSNAVYCCLLLGTAVYRCLLLHLSGNVRNVWYSYVYPNAPCFTVLSCILYVHVARTTSNLQVSSISPLDLHYCAAAIKLASAIVCNRLSMVWARSSASGMIPRSTHVVHLVALESGRIPYPSFVCFFVSLVL